MRVLSQAVPHQKWTAFGRMPELSQNYLPQLGLTEALPELRTIATHSAGYKTKQALRGLFSCSSAEEAQREIVPRSAKWRYRMLYGSAMAHLNAPGNGCNRTRLLSYQDRRRFCATRSTICNHRSQSYRHTCSTCTDDTQPCFPLDVGYP